MRSTAWSISSIVINKLGARRITWVPAVLEEAISRKRGANETLINE